MFIFHLDITDFHQKVNPSLYFNLPFLFLLKHHKAKLYSPATKENLSIVIQKFKIPFQRFDINTTIRCKFLKNILSRFINVHIINGAR